MTSPSFAAAQQRVLARQAAREASLRQNESTQSSSISSRLLTRISTSISPLLSRSGTRPAHRVSQVDAELLDSELLILLKSQITNALKYYGPHIQDDWTEEITLALRAILFKISLWDHDASYGAALQGLRYVDARGKGDEGVRALKKPQAWQKSIYGGVDIFGRYFWAKWEEYRTSLDAQDQEQDSHLEARWMRRFARISDKVSTVYSLAAFASFLVFLVNGRYRTLLDRILRLRLVPSTSQVSREVSFEYLNRQLVWHAFTEFLLFLLPLIGVSRWRRWITRAWRRAKSMTHITSSSTSSEDELGKKGDLAFLPERTCAICYQDQNPSTTSEQEIAALSGAGGGVIGSAATDITNPYECIPCGCVYCFVCLAQRLDAEDGDGWVCLRCGELVKECRSWRGDVQSDEADDEEEDELATTKSTPPTQKAPQAIQTQSSSEIQQLDPTPDGGIHDSIEWVDHSASTSPEDEDFIAEDTNDDEELRS